MRSKNHWNFYFEQIARRVARGISDKELEQELFLEQFYQQIAEQNLIPAGRVLLWRWY